MCRGLGPAVLDRRAVDPSRFRSHDADERPLSGIETGCVTALTPLFMDTATLLATTDKKAKARGFFFEGTPIEVKTNVVAGGGHFVRTRNRFAASHSRWPRTA